MATQQEVLGTYHRALSKNVIRFLLGITHEKSISSYTFRKTVLPTLKSLFPEEDVFRVLARLKELASKDVCKALCTLYRRVKQQLEVIKAAVFNGTASDRNLREVRRTLGNIESLLTEHNCMCSDAEDS